MIWFPGFPQLASAALVPLTAVSLMKERLSISSDPCLEVAGQAINGRLALVVAVDAEPHRVLDVSLRNRLLGDVAVTGGAVDLCADMGRVVELDVIFVGEPVDT